jgi:hypothetical protein
MLHHFSHSELACPTTDELRLATGFGEALERLRAELDELIYPNSACRSPRTSFTAINGPATAGCRWPSITTGDDYDGNHFMDYSTASEPSTWAG